MKNSIKYICATVCFCAFVAAITLESRWSAKATPKQPQGIYVDGRYVLHSEHGGWWVSVDGTNYTYFKEITDAFK